MGINETQKTIMQQINWQILARRRFRFVGMDDKTVRLNLNKKNLDITYNEGQDLYDVQKHTLLKNFDVKTETEKNLYFDQLEETIDRFFNLKGFVQDMKGLLRRAV